MTRASAAPTSRPGSGLEVETASGRVRGALAPGGRVRLWRGIPYAAAPVGARRFAAPEAHGGWAGTREALVNGAAAVQPPAWRPGWVKAALGARRSRGEDCLVLNVWSPAGAAGDQAGLRPVVVWIHGGSFNTGTGGDYDCVPLVERGDVVVVTINYRLGGLGFVNLADSLGGDERLASNVGLRDQQAALRWVQDNIAGFGGDPARVTVAGESAGATGAAVQLASAGARGLIHGVIAQSGALSLTTAREDAERAGWDVLAELGISHERVDRLWQVPASQILGATIRAQARRTGSLITRPWWDGDVLPNTLAEGYDALSPTPLLLGTNLHEHRAFVKTRGDVMPLARGALAASLTDSFGWPEAGRILAEYPAGPEGDIDLGTDLVFRNGSVNLAERHSAAAPVWNYRWDHGHGLLGFGACHALELMFLFPPPPALAQRLMLGPPGEREARAALAARFQDAWLSFVRTGAPDDAWPRYDASAERGGRTTRIWDLHDRLEDDPHQARRLAWAGRDARVR